MISNNEYREKYKTKFTKQAKEILAIPKPEIDCMYHQRKYWIANRGLFREVINIFSQMFQNNGCGIASCDNLIHEKWKNSKNQHPSHSFVYKCFTKLNQKRPLVNFVLFPKVQSLCSLISINFLFLTKWWTFKNYEKCFFSCKKLYSFLRYLNFCIFLFPSFFPCQPLL